MHEIAVRLLSTLLLSGALLFVAFFMLSILHQGIAGVLIWSKNGARSISGFIDRSGRVVFSSADVDERAYFSEGLMPLRNP